MALTSMQLFSMLTVLAAVAIAEALPDRPVGHAGQRLAAMLAAMLIPIAWAAFVSRRTVWQIRLATTDRTDRWHAFQRWETAQAGLCFVFGTLTLYALGWPQLVRANWELDRWPLVDEAAILAPAMLPLFVSWLLFFDADHALRSTTRLAHPRLERWRYALLRVRCYWLLVLVPMVGLLALRDMLRWSVPTAADTPQEWLLSLAYLAAVACLFPIVLKWSWRTESLPAEPLRRRLEQASSRWNVGVKDFLVWKTDYRIVNAAITGLVPSCRYVLLTDGLLRHMTPTEIEAVCAHELGHVDRRHVVLRMMAAVGPPAIGFVCLRSLIGEMTAVGLPIDLEPSLLAAWTVPLGAALYGVTVFGPYARLLEHEADWYACRRLAEDSRQATNTADEALRRGTARFVAMLEILSRLNGQSAWRSSWLHPSLMERMAFIGRLNGSACRAHRFQLHMRRLAWGIMLVTAAGWGLLAVVD